MHTRPSAFNPWFVCRICAGDWRKCLSLELHSMAISRQYRCVICCSFGCILYVRRPSHPHHDIHLLPPYPPCTRMYCYFHCRLMLLPLPPPPSLLMHILASRPWPASSPSTTSSPRHHWHVTLTGIPPPPIRAFTQTVHELLSAGANPDDERDPDVSLECLRGPKVLSRVVISRHADDYVECLGCRVLVRSPHDATYSHIPNVWPFVLPPCICTQRGYTALMVAVRHGKPVCLAALIQAKAEVNLQDEVRWVFWHGARDASSESSWRDVPHTCPMPDSILFPLTCM